MRFSPLSLALLAPLCVSAYGNAETRLTPAEAMAKTVTAIRIQSPALAPVIDGILDDALWQASPYQEGLHQIKPAEFAPATELTRFWVAYDDDFLYVAVQLLDREPDKILALQPIQDKAFESDDQLHISLDPFNQNRDGYFFQVNPNGVRSDALITNRDFMPEWRAIWNAKSTRNEEGWATEIAIPFKSLSFDPKNDTWGFNLGRVIRRKGEFQAWSSRGADVWEMGPAVMADLGPIRGARQGKGLDIQVSGVVARQEDHGTNTAITDTEPSLDVFYKPNPNVTVAATVNTDFSATEVDDRVVNLTRFNLLLPEKRDFFLQDANKFIFGGLNDNGMPFFSRSIGLDELGQPVAIDGGVKFSGRFGANDLGAMAIRQTASGDQHQDADLFVLRTKTNVLDESAIGFIYTKGNPRGAEDNQVVGIDLNYNNSNAFGNKLIQATGWYLAVDDGLDRPGSSAYGASLGYPNSRYSLVWKFKQIGRHFDPAMGFVNRRDIRQHEFESGFTHFFTGGWVKSFRPTFELEFVDDTRGSKQSDYLSLTPIRFDSIAGDEISITYLNTFEHLDEPFLLLKNLDVAPDDYRYDRANVLLQSAIARRFHASAEFEAGNFYDGERRDEIYTLGWRPFASWYLTIKHEIADIALPAGQFTTRLTRVGSELALGRDWAWMILAQYDNLSRQLGVNSRLRWMPQAGTEIYFVINSLQARLEDDSYQAIYDDYRVKAGYTLRF